jgi:hypothetical protein
MSNDEFKFNFLDYYELTGQDIFYILASLTLLIDQERMARETELDYTQAFHAEYDPSDWEEDHDAYWLEYNANN